MNFKNDLRQSHTSYRYVARCWTLLRLSRLAPITRNLSGSTHTRTTRRALARVTIDIQKLSWQRNRLPRRRGGQGIVSVVALGESQPDRPLGIPLPAGSSSSKLAPATMGISHTVQRATVLHPHAPRVNETGGDRSARCCAAHHRQRTQLRIRRSSTARMLRYQGSTAPFQANSPAALLSTHSSLNGVLSSCVRKHSGQIYSPNTCQQHNDTLPLPAQAPYTVCGPGRSGLELASASFICAITKPGETWRTTMQGDAFPPSTSGNASFQIARTKAFIRTRRGFQYRPKYMHTQRRRQTTPRRMLNVRTLLARPNGYPLPAQTTSGARTRCDSPSECRRSASSRRLTFVERAAANPDGATGGVGAFLRLG